jgi:hypothetical protein
MRNPTMKQRPDYPCCSCMAGVVFLANSGKRGVTGVTKEGAGYCSFLGVSESAHCSAILLPRGI